MPIVIVATDVGSAYGEDLANPSTISSPYGTVPVTAFQEDYREDPAAWGTATIQETVDALSSMGILVIGLMDQSWISGAGLGALALLTGATNASGAAIPDGNGGYIADGDPLLFSLNSSSMSTINSGITSALDAAMTSVDIDVALVASAAGMIGAVAVEENKGAGDTATFSDVEFYGDGQPHAFELQFMRDGTSTLLGSIPVIVYAPYDYDVEAIDSDGDILTYELVGDDHGAQIDGATG